MKPILIEILDSLSQHEIKKIKYFIQNKYFNADNAVISLYDYLKKNIKKIGHEGEFNDNTKLDIYQYITTKHKSVDALSNKQTAYLAAKMTLLTNLIRRFLAIEALEEDETFQSMLLNRKLIEKKLFRASEKSIKKQQKILAKQQPKGANYYFQESFLEMDILTSSYLRGTIIRKDNLPELTLSFDTYYLIKRLAYHLTAISLMNISDIKKYDTKRFNIISKLIQLPQYAGHPLIRSYQLAIDMIQNDNPLAHNKLLALLGQYAEEIPKDNLVDFYKSATSFCARRIREGKQEYHQHCFDIYKAMEINGMLKENNFIPINTLKNIITTSCHAREFEWANKTLDKYKPFIRQSVQEEVYHYNKGMITFHQKKYQQAIRHFIRVERVNTNYDINCRMLILKTYYELDSEYSERTIQEFINTKRYIQGNKSLKSPNRKAWKNFVTIITSLYNKKHKVGKTTIERLKEKLESYEAINDKRWLLEKMEEMK